MDYHQEDILRWKKAWLKETEGSIVASSLSFLDSDYYTCEHGYIGCAPGTLCPNHLKSVGGCSHFWEHYKGFTEVYDYCVYCDKKREPIYVDTHTTTY